ncbi:MAG: peptidase S8 [Candidatus Colwellbacteria bacterium CG_4_9_14_0_2_um_filter_50_12]|uniref:Peptidase S8 n=1 Tax=Candidatus Colwellbacteria bacterium CG_4_9_14_0_2_um_filter_50_12 TaxID=1974538 RepID=A0A2M8G0W8_9BACT|nr:MAG: peptidase S8 [Candidatus Colwellbacteria bacterium CG_4_9_14_0_2_um_filter_50_12]
MKEKLGVLAGILLVLGVIGLTGINSVSSANPEPLERKIVVFKSGVLDEPAREALLAKFGAVKTKDLTLINGKAVLLPPKAEAALARQTGVLRIDDDVIVEALVKKAGTPKPQPLEVLPWGIDKIDAELVWPSGNTADPVKLAIIDTGIDVKHPDLTANLKGGVSTVGYTTSYNDDNGHGTHVAGIVGAVDNEIGVIGAGPAIDLYAVKVLDRRGSGYLSDVIEGLDWAIAHGMQVVNMSLGTSADVLSFREAVQRVNSAGIVQVAAAGNSGGSVIYPAAYPEVIAVSATDNTDTIASWSSRGPEIDLAAPGVSIYSTYKGQTYKTLSGTSMAAPHVAGAAALVLNSAIGAYDLNDNDIWDPIEVQNKLQDKAVDLGSHGFDNLYGWGLVNAFNAVQ